MICAGIDAGSRAIKVVLLESESLRVLASGVADQGVEQEALARALLDRLCREESLAEGDIGRKLATGYARHLVSFADEAVTEITCHGCGVRRHLPGARTVIEIGGQDSKLLRLDAEGNIRDFAMNDRCAAGTGRFLEMAAKRLGVEISGLGALAAQSRTPAPISSMCVVFAETEIIGLMASGASPADIVAGVQASIASRIASMAGRNLAEPVVFTGGVALVPGMAEALQSALGRKVIISPDPQMTGALGAAFLAARSARSEKP
ncbi:MAG: acyl-CoA dehydratase activase [Planctomycetota bacterium]